jgi:nucleotide-binding universal stress UspA family protein
MSDTFKTIVIGTSLSAMSDDIVRLGVIIAEAAGAVPWLVHVHSRPGSSAEMFGPVDGKWMAEYEETLRDQLVQQAQRTGLTALPGFGPRQLYSVMGSTHGEITELARREGADLVVLGGSESGALHRLILGSTADGVIRKAPCPVLVVRSAAAFPPARVEIPVDLSPISANALRAGMDFLRRIGAQRANKEALFVLNPLEAEGSLQFTPDQIESFALDALQRFLRANGASPRLGRVRIGYPEKEIVDALEERRADLAILGTHGRQGFERLMLGSVAQGVMRRAACNLLVVPPMAGSRQEAAGESARVEADWKFVSDEVSV